MVGSLPFMIDFVQALALVAGLSWGYGLFRRHIARPGWAPLVLGVLFGCVAVLEMNTPLEPVPGLIIDLRAVPIVLAGAFLGWRGALVCVAIAIAARLSLGGVGMVAGVSAILIAAAGGLAWNYMTRHVAQRKARHLVWLALATSLSLVGGVFLPFELSAWFFGEVALPLAAIYLVSVPLVAALLERERILVEQDKVSDIGEGIDADTGLRGQDRFARDVAHATASGAYAPMAGAIIVKIRDRGFLTGQWGQSVIGHLLGGLRHRFAQFDQSGRVVGIKNDGCFLISVAAKDWARVDEFRAELVRTAAEGVMALPNGQSTRVAVTTRLVRFSDPADVAAVRNDLEARNPNHVAAARLIKATSTARKPKTDETEHTALEANDGLFAHADALIGSRGS